MTGMALIWHPINTQTANHIAYADGYEAMLDIILGFNKTQYGPGDKAALQPGGTNVRQTLISDAHINVRDCARQPSERRTKSRNETAPNHNRDTSPINMCIPKPKHESNTVGKLIMVMITIVFYTVLCLILQLCRIE